MGLQCKQVGAICGWGVEGDGELKRRGGTLADSRVSTSGNPVVPSMETGNPREVAGERKTARSLLLSPSWGQGAKEVKKKRPNCEATVLEGWETGETGELITCSKIFSKSETEPYTVHLQFYIF